MKKQVYENREVFERTIRQAVHMTELTAYNETEQALDEYAPRYSHRGRTLHGECH